jgi:hypothetical protein
MSESNRLFVMHDLRGSQPGERFSTWPQHLTITPPFVHIGIQKDDVIDYITDTVSSVSPFHIEAGELAIFGLTTEILAINVLDNSGRLRQLHTSLIGGLDSLGCKFDNKDFCLDNYSPHVKHKEDNLLNNHPHLVSSITIAEKFPDIFHLPKKILKKIELK